VPGELAGETKVGAGLHPTGEEEEARPPGAE
jgi:hypothetical protein